MKHLHVVLVAAVLGSASGSLMAREDPLELKVTDLEARLVRIERVIQNQSLIQLASEVERLRSENQALRGEIDKLRYDSTNSDSRQRELYVDLDRRLQALEAAPRVVVAPPPRRRSARTHERRRRPPRRLRRRRRRARSAAISRTIRRRSI